MKSTPYYLIFILALLCLSCVNEEGNRNGGGEIISVKLNPSVLEIDQGSLSPLNTRSSVTDTTTVYAVQIYENNIPYYYGLFNDPSKMQVSLVTGNIYKLKIAVYQTGTGSGLNFTEANGLRTYYLPNEVTLDNKFYQGNRLVDINKISSTQLMNQNTQNKYPEIDAFYYEKAITAEQGITSIDLPLKRMGFGISFNIRGLASGKISVSFGNDLIEFTPLNTTYSSVRSFNKDNGDFSSILNNTGSYSESIIINAKWIGDNGSTLTSTQNIPFIRNYKRTVNITLNSSSLKTNFEEWNTVSVWNQFTDYQFIDSIGSYFASDKLEGRSPGSRGDTLSVAIIQDVYQKIGLSSINGGSYVKSFITAQGKNTSDVIGIVPGTDPLLKNEYIVISANYDHWGKDSYGNILNGADNNASGVSGICLLARKILNSDFKPKRTIVFISTGALPYYPYFQGIKYFLSSNFINNSNIKYGINLEVIGRLQNNSLYIYQKNLTSNHIDLINQSNNTGLSLSFSTANFYTTYTAEHVVLGNLGIPSFTFSTGWESDLEKPTDDWPKVNVDGILKIVDLSFAVLQAINN